MPDNSEPLEILIDADIFPRLLGVGDQNLRYLDSVFRSKLTARDGKIFARGPAGERPMILRVFTDLEALSRKNADVSTDDIDTILRLAGFNGQDGGEGRDSGSKVYIQSPRVTVYARGPHQERYIKLMDKLSFTFAIGPAGTGKTYLAVAAAVNRLHERMVDKIILVRPVIETGETLGFLPGDILEKVDPYFRPLYDALDEMLSRERVRLFIERGMIEIAPLAYMRGRTLNNAFVILDEAQNTTSGQMKMFLTRFGHNSKAVITGDLTQIDLSDPTKSGLLEARSLLQGIDGIGFVEFDDADVVRHRIVADIIRAYQIDNGALSS